MPKAAILSLLCFLLPFAGIPASLPAQDDKRPLLKEDVWKTDVLKSADEVDRVTGTPCKEYEIELQAEQTYVIDMEARTANFDCYLRLKDADGRQWASDDDGGQGFNARIVFRCTRAGKYIVVAATFAGDVGSFALIVRKPIALKGGIYAQADSFAAADHQLIRGLKRVERPFRTYPVLFTAGTSYRIEATADDVKGRPALLLRTWENWVRIRDDNPHGAQQARMDFACPETDYYFIVVTTTEPEDRGGYQLRITRLEPSPGKGN